MRYPKSVAKEYAMLVKLIIDIAFFCVEKVAK